MLIGYARVSTDEQNTEAQAAALRERGCTRVYREVASGAARERVELERALDALRESDTLVVWKLDRVARSLSHLLQILDRVHSSGAAFISISDGVDTSGAAGRMLAGILGSIAEFERELIIERTRAGLTTARDAGRVGGRPRALSRERLVAVRQLAEQGRSVRELARMFAVSPSTIRRSLSD